MISSIMLLAVAALAFFVVKAGMRAQSVVVVVGGQLLAVLAVALSLLHLVGVF